ncbi:RDD family protein [Kribbella sp. CA-294648]|uniref:RDD family protein n=1 Tax=Kribbella sp. CA-294648 TaxID=3239948 RepID=UPI003D8DD4A0
MSQLVTGEAVVLQVRIARMPTRALACAIDFVIQMIVLGTLLGILLQFLIVEASPALGAALVIITVLLVLIGYKVVMETLTRGKTLGKLMLGLKVVRDDGSSIRFRHALVRALLWLFVDFAPWFAASPGIVASLMNKQGKRIGDMVAGTVVIRERHQPMASPPLFVPGHLVQWAQSLELSRLTDDLANTAREYLARFIELEPAARVALGDELAYRVGQVTAPAPPVPIIAPAFLSAVLAERRRRELTRLATARATYSTTTGPFSHPTPYSAPTGPFTPPGQYSAPTGPFTPPGQYSAPTGPFTPPGQYSAPAGPFGPPGQAAAPANPYAVPAGPFAPPSPYGAQPAQYSPAPRPQDRPYPGPPPAPAQEPTKVNAEGWHAPGSEPDQWS